MKLAIMQPYFLPYHGYWQLISQADKFVIFDDVNFIKRGWINRNRILVNGQPEYLTIPVQNASQNRLINETLLSPEERWRGRLLKTVHHAYGKATFFELMFPVFEDIVSYQDDNLSGFVTHSIRKILDVLSIETDIIATSKQYDNWELRGQGRILDICRQEAADTYINSAGGRDLYEAGYFEDAGVSLRFLTPAPLAYPHHSQVFHENLSILDVLMEIGPDGFKRHLPNCKIVR